MKKPFILLFFLTMIWGTTIGQPYKSIFGQAQTAWNVVYQLDECKLTDSLVVGGDTTIWGVDYKKIIDYYDPLGMPFFGCIREDTNTGRVWYLDYTTFFDEFLVMDLSLNVGDSFLICNLGGGIDTAYVDSIKYVGSNKCVILSCSPFSNPVLSMWYEKLKFIEGIGPNAGIIFQIHKATDFWGGRSYLLCAYKDNVQIYTNTSNDFYGQCRVHLGSIDENKFDFLKLKLFPNPSSDKIKIDYNGCQPFSIEIYNYTGKLISLMTDINSSLFDIDMTEYPHGIYLIKVKGNDGKYATGRVLKL
jgi:hypothetical protein